MTQQKDNQAKASFKGVVQLPLTEEHVPQVVQYETNLEELLQDLDTLLRDGYTVSLDHDPSRNQYTCKVYAYNRSSFNAGLQFYSNAPTPFGALAVALVKHFFVAGGGSWEKVPQEQQARYS